MFRGVRGDNEKDSIPRFGLDDYRLDVDTARCKWMLRDLVSDTNSSTNLSFLFVIPSSIFFYILKK